LLAGKEPPSAGAYRLGHNVQADYFAQDQYKELDQDARIFDDLAELSPRSTQTELRSLLGCFLFSADEVFKRIGVLSGGERNRYALLRMLLHRQTGYARVRDWRWSSRSLSRQLRRLSLAQRGRSGAIAGSRRGCPRGGSTGERERSSACRV